MPKEHRQLLVTLFADIAGYTELMQRDENLAMQCMTKFKAELEKQVPASQGRIIQYYGDGCLATFESALEGVRCAIGLQEAFQLHPEVPVRLGMHLGDAVYRDGNVFGDSVNVASRIESMGMPGAVLISASVNDQIRNHDRLQTVSLGSFDFKNVAEPVEVFAIDAPSLNVPAASSLTGKFKSDKRKRNPLPLIAGILFVMIAGYLLAKSYGPQTDGDIRTLGIMPFAMDGEEQALNYLAEGIPENLINRMSQSTEIDVLSRNSTFALNEQKSDLSALRKHLPADIILTGSLDRIQNFIVLNCQLVDLETGNQLWGHKGRYPAGDIFALEDSIAAALEEPLKVSLRTPSTEYVPDPEAYTHYLKGRLLTYGSTPEEADKALEHFRSAVAIDDKFALAYAGIAKVKFVAAMFGNTTSAELISEARSATQRALQLEPGLLEAHLAEANIRFYLEHDWDRAEAAFKEASAIDPNNVDLNIEYAYFQNMMGRYVQARDLADIALQSDPISTASLHMAAWTRLFTDEYSEAASLLEKALELRPNWAWGWLKLGIAQALDGDCEAGTASTTKCNELVDGWGAPLLQAYVGIMYAHCGHEDKAAVSYDTMIAAIDSTTGVTEPFSYMAINAGVGNKEQVVYWAQKGLEQKVVACYAMNTIPKLQIYDQGMFDDPGFISVLEALNFPSDSN